VNTRSATCNVCKLTARNEEELKDHMAHAHNYKNTDYKTI